LYPVQAGIKTGDEYRKDVHGFFWVLVILRPTLHELENNFCRAVGKREEIDVDILAYRQSPD
jgi:hypothetical protein